STDLVAIEPTEPTKPATESPPAPVPAPENPSIQPAPGDAGTTAVAPVDAAVASATCVVNVSSSPDDAEIVLDKDRIAGRTPLKLELPCNAEAKVLVRKHGYFGVARSVTPTADPGDLKDELSRAVYQLKVSSTPAGATVTVNGKSGGVTPTTVKVTAFEPTTI